MTEKTKPESVPKKPEPISSEEAQETEKSPLETLIEACEHVHAALVRRHQLHDIANNFRRSIEEAKKHV